jgi:hypothetical protein
MDNVIHVNFGNNTVDVEDEYIIEIHLNTELDNYLDCLRVEGIDEDDVLEVEEAINNADVYFAADDVVQKFADEWLEQFL